MIAPMLGPSAAPAARLGGRPIKRVRRWVRYQAARGTIATLAHVPRTPARAVFGTLGSLAYALMPGQRRLVTGQIDRVYADRPRAWRRRVARCAFMELAFSAVDVARLARGSAEELRSLVELPGAHALAPLVDPDRGAVVIGGHTGAWELVPPLLSVLGARVTTLVRPVREARLDRLVTRLRLAHGGALAERDTDARALVRQLGAGTKLAIAADQLPRGREVAGTLLGFPVGLPAGPAALAIAAGVPLVPVAMRRRGRRHLLVVGDPIEIPPGASREERIGEMMARYAEVLGGWIDDAPAQWAWFHERWRDAR